MSEKPSLRFIEPWVESKNTIIVLHGNNGSPEDIYPLYQDLTSEGWRVALACSGQRGESDTYVWNNLKVSSSLMHEWAEGAGGSPYWAGFSAGAYVVLKDVLQGLVPASGVLAVAPSIPDHPEWWPQGWSEKPVGVPVAFVVGEHDHLTPPEDTRAFAAKIAGQGVPTRVWGHAGGHEHSEQWPALRGQALAWLLQETKAMTEKSA